MKESVRIAKSVIVAKDSIGTKLQKQLTIKQCNDEVKIVTQKMLDEKILNYVIEEVTPKSIVEKAAFKELVLMGLPKNLKVMCRKTLDVNINKQYTKMTDNLRKELLDQQYISAIANLWSKGKRSV